MLKFLDLQAQHFEESLPCELNQHTTAHKLYAASIENESVVCGKGVHPLSSCGKLQGLSREEPWELVMKNARCKNCLKPGYITTKCRVPPTCRKCRKYHHTLLHREAETKPEEKKESTSTSYAASSRTGKEVPLLTCRVNVIAPDGSVTLARALLDCAASTSLITERLAQQLYTCTLNTIDVPPTSLSTKWLDPVSAPREL